MFFYIVRKVKFKQQEILRKVICKRFKHFTLLKTVFYQLLFIEELICTKMKWFLKIMVAQICLPVNLTRLGIHTVQKKRDYFKSAYVKISMQLYHANSKDKSNAI